MSQPYLTPIGVWISSEDETPRERLERKKWEREQALARYGVTVDELREMRLKARERARNESLQGYPGI